MAKRAVLTVAAIRAKAAAAKRDGKALWLADGAIQRGAGGLHLRFEPTGVIRAYFRYKAPDGSSPRMPLGLFVYDPMPGCLTLPEARAAAAEKAEKYRRHESRDVRVWEESERRRIEDEMRAAEEAEARRLAEAAQRAADAAQEREAAAKHTLAALFDTYVAHLRKQGKSSAYDAENMFRLHVTQAHPEIAQKPANAVRARDVVGALRSLTEAGKGRTAAKLRSFLRAAYALAARVATDPEAPAAFLAFNVEANPVQDTAALSKYNIARERALSAPELSAFWKALAESPADTVHDALRLLLLLGGQRPAQLARTVAGDVDASAGTITLRDPKGRREQARLHVLPLTDAALSVIQRCIARADAQREKRGGEGPRWLFSTHGGAALRPETVTQACNDIASALLARPQGERIVQEPFQLRDIRRTCETRLAAIGISKDVRAQLQSHGLGGVQARHYDRHDYLDEKRAALVAWCAFLETKPADNVRQLRQSAA